jgi:hypothetical protein
MDPNESIAALRDTLINQGKILKLLSISDVVRRDCALLILHSITDFLQSWFTETRSEIPIGIIREGLALALSELGPGDPNLRSALLETIRNTSNGRQQLLDVLPYAMPLDDNEREVATDTILEVFRDVLLQDSTSLLCIIGSLSSLSLSDQGRQEAWKLALTALPEAEPEDLPVVVQSLLRNVTGKDEALQAFDGIRDLVDDFSLVGSLILAELQQESNGQLLCDAYMEILGQMRAACLTGGSQRNDSRTFVQLDLVVLLDLFQRSHFKSMIESLLDDVLLSSSFPFEELVGCVSALRHRERSVFQERMPPALLELCLFFLLAPVRLPSIDTTLILSQTHDVAIDLHRRFDRVRQEELVRSLLHLGDEVASIVASQRKRRLMEIGYRERLDATCRAVHGLVLALAIDDPLSINRFKFVLVERLTTEKRSSGYKEVCAILVSLLDEGLGGGMDSTELMILLQKLLFSSSGIRSQGTQPENAHMVGRGLVLASSMVQSHALPAKDRDCIFQWVLKIVLPSNRRTVQSVIGTNGLDFLSTWAAQQHGGNADVFQHIKMIMANTGLVQVKEAYLQRNRPNIDLAYNETPFCFTSSASDVTSTRRRNLLFCPNTFLHFRGFPSPTDWAGEVSWVFTLVDTYLRQGRKQSNEALGSKWLPDGWLEAAIELPTFPISSDYKPDDGVACVLKNYVVGDIAHNLSQLNRLRTSLLGDNDFLSRKKHLESLLRLACALLLSIGLSIAVLGNSHDHFMGLQGVGKLTEETKGRERDLLNLLKYQLLKIYDLHDRVKFLLNFVELLALALRRRGKSDSSGCDLLSQEKVLSEGASHGREVLSSLMRKLSTLDVELIKVCMIGESDFTFLFQKEALIDGTNTDIAMIVLLRVQILEQSISAYQTHRVSVFLNPDVLRHGCMVLANVLPIIHPNPKPSDKVVSQRAFDLARLSSSYLEYIICAIDYVLYERESSAAGPCLMMLKCMIRGENDLDEDQSNLPADLFDQFLRDLQGLADPSLALQVVEILALIASLDPTRLLKRALDACWRMMHTIYSSAPTALKTGVSTSFDRISSNFLRLDRSTHQASKVLRASIVKCSRSQLKDFTSQLSIRRSLLLLWSLLSQPLASRGQEAAMLSSLVDDIEKYLQGPNENIAPNNRHAKSNETPSAGSFGLSSIPSLNGGTLSIYVEMAMHLIISTFAVVEPARRVERRSPFSHLVDFPRLFGRLLTLTGSNLSLFPRRFVQLLFSCCHHLLELTISQTQACVDWRNAQPLLTFAERHAGKTDSASVHYLEAFLQDICAASCGTVISFCGFARNSVDQSFEGCSRKVTGLLLASERTASMLKGIALTHNVEPAKDFNRKGGSEPIGMKYVDVNGFDIHNGNDPVEPSFAKLKKRRVTPTVLAGGGVEPDREAACEWVYDEDYESSDEFGAVGDWGSDDSDEESNEPASLELADFTLTRFPMRQYSRHLQWL